MQKHTPILAKFGQQALPWKEASDPWYGGRWLSTEHVSMWGGTYDDFTNTTRSETYIPIRKESDDVNFLAQFLLATTEGTRKFPIHSSPERILNLHLMSWHGGYLRLQTIYNNYGCVYSPTFAVDHSQNPWLLFWTLIKINILIGFGWSLTTVKDKWNHAILAFLSTVILCHW